MKGIVLAGGSGTRLYPLTISNSKQMLPVYDKPMVYYPIATLMIAGIRDILIISTPNDVGNFVRLLGDGTDFGVRLTYAVQPFPGGLAQAFLIARDFINGQPCAMVLGDNIFYGDGFGALLKLAMADAKEGKATVFGLDVPDPQRFGVVEFDENGDVVSIVEKPKEPRSNYAVTGLYFYPGDVSENASTLKPSARGELEITDLNNIYLKEKRLKVQLLKNGFKWWDTGTFDSLMDAAKYVQDLTLHHGRSICSPEAIAYAEGWIAKDILQKAAEKYSKNSYGEYLKSLLGRSA